MQKLIILLTLIMLIMSACEVKLEDGKVFINKIETDSADSSDNQLNAQNEDANYQLSESYPTKALELMNNDDAFYPFNQTPINTVMQPPPSRPKSLTDSTNIKSGSDKPSHHTKINKDQNQIEQKAINPNPVPQDLR